MMMKYDYNIINNLYKNIELHTKKVIKVFTFIRYFTKQKYLMNL